MLTKGIDYDEAYTRVREGRPICAPNTSFICSLLEWQRRREKVSPQCSPRSADDSSEELLGIFSNMFLGLYWKESIIHSSRVDDYLARLKTETVVSHMVCTFLFNLHEDVVCVCHWERTI